MVSLPEVELPNPDASRALLIGVSRYAKLADLTAVDANVTDLKKVLTDPRCWGLSGQSCTVLDSASLGQPDSLSLVMTRLEAVATEARDALVVYYAGHGLTDPEDEDELYLALPGSDDTRPHYTALPFKHVRRAVRQSRASRKVVIVDCCYSGLAHGRGMSATSVGASLVIRGTCVLTATPPTRKALSLAGEPHSAFTGELIRLLTTGIVNGPPLLDMETLYLSLRERLRSRGLPEPDIRNQELGGRIALARNGAHAAPPPANEILQFTVAGSNVGTTTRSRYVRNVAIATVLVAALATVPASVPAGLASETAAQREAASAQNAIRDSSSGSDPTPPPSSRTADPSPAVFASPARAVAFHPNLPVVAKLGMDNSVWLWDVKSNKLAGKKLGYADGPDDADLLAFDASGSLLAAGTSQAVTLFSVTGKRQVGKPLTIPGSLNTMAFSPDGKTLVTGGADGVVRLWDVARRKSFARFRPPRNSDDSKGITAVAVGPDGRVVATGTHSGALHLWRGRGRLADGGLYTSQEFRYTSALGPPNGTRTVPVGMCLAGDAVQTVIFSPDGTRLATSKNCAGVALWSVAGRQPIGKPIVGYTAAIAFSPGGQTLAVGNDEQVELWTVSTRTRARVVGNQPDVYSLAMSPDGKQLCTTASDGTRIWPIGT